MSCKFLIDSSCKRELCLDRHGFEFEHGRVFGRERSSSAFGRSAGSAANCRHQAYSNRADIEIGRGDAQGFGSDLGGCEEQCVDVKGADLYNGNAVKQ